jgi:hypothetical protein
MMYEFFLENEVETVDCTDTSSTSQSTSITDTATDSNSSTDSAFVSIFFVTPFALIVFRRKSGY